MLCRRRQSTQGGLHPVQVRDQRRGVRACGAGQSAIEHRPSNNLEDMSASLRQPAAAPGRWVDERDTTADQRQCDGAEQSELEQASSLHAGKCCIIAIRSVRPCQLTAAQANPE